MSAAEPVVIAEGVTRIYLRGREEVHALRGVDLTVFQGEILCVAGRSGSGKSTLLHLLGALDRPTAGRVLHGTVDTSRASERDLVLLRRMRVGFVFQSFHLVPHLNAVENVALPLRYRGLAPGIRLQQAREALGQVGLEARAAFRPDELSGGEVQRVAVARALVGGPAVILADEPNGELDAQTAAEMTDLFVRLNRERGQTFVIATHDADVADRSHRVATLEDGRIKTIRERASDSL